MNWSGAWRRLARRSVDRAVEALQRGLGRRLLELGQAVVIEWGTWARGERVRCGSGRGRWGAAVELYYVSAPLEV